MRSYLFLFLFLLFGAMFNACRQPAKPGDEQPAPIAADAVTFQFSRAEMVPVLEKEGNWCRRSYAEAIMISADPANFNRRYFRLDNGIFKINVRLGSTVSAFFLRRAGEKKVEVFTSKNFPECLSSTGNFTLNPDATMISCDNKKHIHYTVDARQDSAGLLLFIGLPTDAQYGLTVHRCSGCL